MISFIVAMDDNRVIGNDNQLPWHLPEDLKFFKRVTMGHPIVMGRKTFVSIGRTLPGRENIVITRDVSFQYEGCTVFNHLENFLSYCQQKPEQEFFVIGGAEIFKQLLHKADRLYITEIHASFEGDTFFPPIAMNEWQLTSKEKGLKDEKNPYDYDFIIFERK